MGIATAKYWREEQGITDLIFKIFQTAFFSPPKQRKKKIKVIKNAQSLKCLLNIKISTIYQILLNIKAYQQVDENLLYLLRSSLRLKLYFQHYKSP